MNGLNWGMTLFIIILSYAVSIGARLMIKLTFLKYDDIATAKKISGAEAARAVLDGDFRMFLWSVSGRSFQTAARS